MAAGELAGRDRDNISNRFAFRWLIAFCLWFSLLIYGGELERALYGRNRAELLLLFLGLALSISWFVALIVNAVRRCWWRTASLAVAPLVGFGLIFTLVKAGATPERIRFEFNRKFYESEVGPPLKTGEPRFHKFAWGSEGGFVTSPYISHELVFDESDEIGRPSEDRSIAWRERLTPKSCLKEQHCAVFETAGRKTVQVTKVSGHFYLVTETWQ